MYKSSKSILRGVKATRQVQPNKKVPHKKRKDAESQERIDTCLSCTKPMSECKGNCFGRC